MRFRQGFVLGILLVPLALWLAGPAQAASVSGRASTVIEWFDTGEEKTAVPVYQYLLFNVSDIDGKGLNFRAYGRLADDLKDEVDADSRLYYAYLEKKGLLDGLDVKLGRQFISTAAGASLMDGLYLDYSKLGPVGLRLFGGGDVSFYEGYNAKDLIGGLSVYGTFFDSLKAELSYVQRWDQSALANELFGLSLDYDYANILNLYSETQFNYLSNSVSYFLAGAKYHRNPKYTVRAEYLYSLPVFSSTSIYSVFAVDEYQELMAELTYRLEQPGLQAFARYTREFYLSDADANVFEAGLEKIRTNRCAGYLSAIYRDDADGQDLVGAKVYGSYLFNESLKLGLGAHLDVLERRIDDSDDETTSTRLWADATYYFNKKINVEAKVERTESDLWDEYYRGRVRLNIRF